MQKHGWRYLAALVPSLALGVYILTGCSGPAPKAQAPQPQTSPATGTAEKPPVQPPNAPVTPPPVVPDQAEPKETVPAAPDNKPTEEPEQRQSQAPKYVTVLERLHNNEPYTVTGVIESPAKLVLETSNVSRLRIERRQLTMARNRSIVLRIDGRGIEWSSGSQSVELVRGRDGVWSPVEPLKPSKP